MMTKFTEKRQVGHLKSLFINIVNCLYANINLNLKKNSTQNNFAKGKKLFLVKNVLQFWNLACYFKFKKSNFKNYSSQFSIKYLPFL